MRISRNFRYYKFNNYGIKKLLLIFRYLINYITFHKISLDRVDFNFYIKKSNFLLKKFQPLRLIMIHLIV